MNKLVLIAALVLLSLVLAPPNVQAQTSPTNAAANSQGATSNAALWALRRARRQASRQTASNDRATKTRRPA
jgi:Tfp pilus assembly protein PilV